MSIVSHKEKVVRAKDKHLRNLCIFRRGRGRPGRNWFEVADSEVGYKVRGGQSLGDQGTALSRATEWSVRMVRADCPDC